MFIFYQINRDGAIRTRDRLVIKTVIPYHITITTQKLKLLNKLSGYNLYYSLASTISRQEHFSYLVITLNSSCKHATISSHWLLGQQE